MRLDALFAAAALLCGVRAAAPSAATPPQAVFQSGADGRGGGLRSAPGTCPASDAPRHLRVAVIGAGASGASAAYFLSRAHAQLARDGDAPECVDGSGAAWGSPRRSLHIDMFERSGVVGGRTATVQPLDDPGLPPVEIGASIFSNVNYNLVHASETFHLERTAPRNISTEVWGLWDGKKFLVDYYDGSTWSQLKMYWRYGRSPQVTMKIVDKAVSSFLRVYSPRFLHDTRRPSGYPWRSVHDLVASLGFARVTAESARDHFIAKRVSALFVDDMVNAGTRMNYAQDVDDIHAFAGQVALGARGATSVRGGNAQLFEAMVNASGATVHFGAAGEVTGLMKLVSYATQPCEGARWSVGTRDGYGRRYDAVLVAAPWQDSRIVLLNTDRTLPAYAFQRLHVVVIATDAPHPSAAYFGHDASYEYVPRTILTTPGAAAFDPPLANVTHGGQEYSRVFLVKLFSRSELDDAMLASLFFPGRVLWAHRKAWDAYPKLTPTTKLAPFVVDDNLYNINAMERWVSTMETSTVAAKNVVALVLEKWLGTSFVRGSHCAFNKSTPGVALDWASWGCYSS
ncbi:hypothetical protein MSPP1_002019 [Malassezia sp. CBS 17886]|nr:hypothetical protein MSPP1_002019 [Malassezia sp. CBS 17886]